MHEFGHGKRDGFSVASNATATTRSTCSSGSSEESSGTKLRGSGKDKGTSSRRRVAGPPRTSSREGRSRTNSREAPSRTSGREGLSKGSSASGEFGSFDGSNAFDSSSFTDFSESFGMQNAPAATPGPAAAPPKQRARRRASVAGGTPVAPAPAAPIAQQPDPVEPQRRAPDRQRSRSGERSTASSGRPGGRRTTRRSSNGDGAADGGVGLSRSKSSEAIMGFDDNGPSNNADGADMFGYGDGSPTGAADYGYGGGASAADFGYEDQNPPLEMDYGYGDEDAPPQPKKELPRAKLSRARRSSIGVTQFGGSSDAFLNDLCGRSTRDLMSEKDVEKPKPKPAAGPSIAMPLAEGPSKAGGAARRGGGRRASLIGGMNVGVGLTKQAIGLTKQTEKLDDSDSRKSKASFFKDRSGDKAKAPTRNKSAGDGIQSYNPDRDRRQMMKD